MVTFSPDSSARHGASMQNRWTQHGVGELLVAINSRSEVEQGPFVFEALERLGYDLMFTALLDVGWGGQDTFRRLWFENSIQVVNSHGTNADEFRSDPPFLTTSMNVGAVLADGTRATGSYGPGVELGTSFNSQDASQSFSSAMIAALMGRIYDSLTGTDTKVRWFEARALCREMASAFPGGWNEDRGWGYVDVDAAIPSSYSVQAPLEIVIEETGGVVECSWLNFRTPDWRATQILMDGDVIYEGTGNRFTIQDPVAGTDVEIRSIANDDTTSTPEDFTVLTLA